jgi:predicted hydrocarbon binding protein
LDTDRGTMVNQETDTKKMLSKEILVGRIESGKRLAQIVVTMKDEIGAVASVNALTASLRVDIRQSASYSLPDGSSAIYNAFVVINDTKVTLDLLVKRLEESPFVLEVQAFEGRDGVIVDGISFPINWQGRRVVILSQPATTRMFDTIRSVLGSGGEVVLYQQGSYYGKELAKFFMDRLGEDYMRKNYDYGLGLLAATGWGIPEWDVSKKDFPNMRVKLSSCFECEGVSSRRELCSFMRGFLSGVFGTIAGHLVHCEESRCKAKGDPFCEFELHSGRSTLTR